MSFRFFPLCLVTIAAAILSAAPAGANDVLFPWTTSTDGNFTNPDSSTVFYNDGVTAFGELNADNPGAVTAGLQIFSGLASLNVSSSNAISGDGVQFREDSTMRLVAVASTVHGASISFNDNSTLHVFTGSAIMGGAFQFFDNFQVYFDAPASFVDGYMSFFRGTVLNAEPGAIVGGTLDFLDDSVLNANGADAL